MIVTWSNSLLSFQTKQRFEFKGPERKVSLVQQEKFFRFFSVFFSVNDTMTFQLLIVAVSSTAFYCLKRKEEKTFNKHAAIKFRHVQCIVFY